jgi:hypothetical protein
MVQANDLPSGTAEVPGITHRRSSLSVSETVDRLRGLMQGAGATVFAVIGPRPIRWWGFGVGDPR